MSKKYKEEKFSDSLGTQINLAARWMRTALEKELASDGVTPTQWMLLMAVGSKSRQLQTELGKMVNLDNATITRGLDKLQSSNLIVRNQDKNDRRAQKVSLTPKGRRVCREWNAIGKRVNDLAAAGLAATDRKRLIEWLSSIIDNLNDNYSNKTINRNNEH